MLPLLQKLVAGTGIHNHYTTAMAKFKRKSAVRRQHETGDYDNFLRKKVEAGRASLRAGTGAPNAEVEAAFAVRRARIPKP